jgi:lipopolysaccharide/colanic/teichoic acid biosynthesis glycosyltransferase
MSSSGSGVLSQECRRVASIRTRHDEAIDPPVPLPPSTYFTRKAILDRALAGLLLIPGLLMIGLLALLARLTSRGPGICSQVRTGQGGRTFVMYKIRTMKHDAEAASGPVWAQARDPRITAVGRVLRKLHLDELPQLLNVLKGEMSLVGPRPERPEFVHVLAEAIPGYLNRLVVPPGITGLAQLNLPPDSDLNSVHRKLALDCEYIERAGLLLDLRLIGCTLFRIFKVPERWLLFAFGLHRKVTILSLPKAGPSGNNGTGAENATITPASIPVQLTSPPANGDDLSPGWHEHRNEHLRLGESCVKPR